MAGLVYAGAPVRARFELSRPALERFAASKPAGEDARWVGLFHVESVERIPGGVRFLVVGSGFLDHHGFVFSPERAPEDDGEGFRYAHLSGPWYTWQESD
ncbi:hypothetical protein [Nonomuraea sediminis]|uniref:hypothetical protein n=1 Tax=Nonomuraea sediminis TaxID=2835864 RepID=UPI001BDD65EE|nr:hypothetical protein [Nonomuraea sediminis]